MKSLIRKAQSVACCTETAEAKGEQAQCCAKVSKNVAGCHD